MSRRLFSARAWLRSRSPRQSPASRASPSEISPVRPPRKLSDGSDVRPRRSSARSTRASAPPFLPATTCSWVNRVASGWTVRLTLIVAVVPFVLGVLDLLVRGRRRMLPLASAARAMRARLSNGRSGVCSCGSGYRGCLPDRRRAPAPAELVVLTDWHVSGLAVLTVAFALGWLVARRPLVPTSLAHPGTATRRLHHGAHVARRRCRGRSAAEATRCPVFVLPSLYAWVWLPLRQRFWSRIGVYLAGLLGPVVGLLLARP